MEEKEERTDRKLEKDLSEQDEDIVYLCEESGRECKGK